jgi:hypothetical protein
MTEERMAATAFDVTMIVVLDAHPKLHDQHYPELAGRHKPQLAQFGQYIAGAIATAPPDEGPASDCLGPLDPRRVLVARTASRSVLGLMNDMASMSADVAAQSGGITHLDVERLNAFLRRTPTTAAALSARSTPPGSDDHGDQRSTRPRDTSDDAKSAGLRRAPSRRSDELANAV